MACNCRDNCSMRAHRAGLPPGQRRGTVLGVVVEAVHSMEHIREVAVEERTSDMPKKFWLVGLATKFTGGGAMGTGGGAGGTTP